MRTEIRKKKRKMLKFKPLARKKARVWMDTFIEG